MLWELTGWKRTTWRDNGGQTRRSDNRRERGSTGAAREDEIHEYIHIHSLKTTTTWSSSKHITEIYKSNKQYTHQIYLNCVRDNHVNIYMQEGNPILQEEKTKFFRFSYFFIGKFY